MAVTFMDPVNPYVLSDRATKYAVLFIVLTFGSVALSEFLGRRRVHPVQYTLVGLALTMFFLLLLSLSEHIAFGQACALASASCVALLTFYGRFMLGSWRRGGGQGLRRGLVVRHAVDAAPDGAGGTGRGFAAAVRRAVIGDGPDPQRRLARVVRWTAPTSAGRLGICEHRAAALGKSSLNPCSRGLERQWRPRA